MALNGLFCADVPLRNYSLTRLCPALVIIVDTDQQLTKFQRAPLADVCSLSTRR